MRRRMTPLRPGTIWSVSSSSIALLLFLAMASPFAVSALLNPQSSSSTSSSSSSSSSSSASNNDATTSSEDGTRGGSDNCTRDRDPSFPHMLKRHLASIGSTQDEARRIVTDPDLAATATGTTNMVCVTATEQTNGRGTSGRAWMGARGNAFVTIAIPQHRWMDHRHLPLTLLPLTVGILVAQKVQALVGTCFVEAATDEEPSRPRVTLKWPNDVLVNEDKIAGILIESSETGWFLIGIGVNLAYAPPVPTEGPEHGRTSTSLSNHCPSPTDKWEDLAHRVGVDLARDLDAFLDNPPMLSDRVVDEWKQWADFDMELTMRDTPNRERVKVVDMLPDGRIRVVGQDDGVSQVLVADYFI